MFRHDFNLGFGWIKVDTCSECLRLRTLYKSKQERDKKKKLLIELADHKMSSKRFFTELNLRPEETMTINFDLMQNQPLPKTSVSEASYARQLWYYTFGIVIHDDNKSLNKNTNSIFLRLMRWTK